METNVILKYRRENDCWACPNCDSENSMSFGRCVVCGYERNPSVPIIKAWSPEQEQMERMAAARTPVANPVYRTDYPRPMHSSAGYDSGSSKESGGGMAYLWIVIAVVVILLLLIAVVVNA